MFDDEDVEPIVLLEMVDKVERLGLGYYFKQEITRSINKLISSNASYGENLHAVALSFRLLRQHGHEVSQGTYFSELLHFLLS